MAKVVELPKGREFTFRRKGNKPKYDWDAWLNGDLLMIEQSKGVKNDKGEVVKITKKGDYETDTENMPGKIKSVARRRYKKVNISKLDAEGKPLVDALIIQAKPMNQEERVAEDARRRNEREARKLREAEEKGLALAYARQEAGEDDPPADEAPEDEA